MLVRANRIPAPSPEVFVREYVDPGLPVILTDLFDDAPLRRLDSQDAVRAELNDLPLRIQPNYISAFIGRQPAETREMLLGDYLAFVEANPRTMDLCVEFPTPDRLQALLPLGDYGKIEDEQDVYSNMFLAAAGNFAHLHYDPDQRDVLLYQVFGKKRVVVVHPRETHKLDALDQLRLHRTSGLFLENFSTEDQRAFLEYVHATDAMLEPGETLFIPKMAWHYIEYPDTAMSVAYRLGRNRAHRTLAEMAPVPTVDVQALAVELARHRSDPPGWLAELEAAARSLQGAEREALNATFLRVRDEVLGPRQGSAEGIYSIRERERRADLAPSVGAVAREWGPADRPVLAPDVRIMSNVAGGPLGAVVIARGARLVSEMASPNPRWLLPALGLLGDRSSFTVAEIATRAEGPISDVGQLMCTLEAHGFLTRGV